MQPSLVNIYKELEADLNIPHPNSGDLTRWAENGVLLLNTSLTVYEHEANSHINWGWQKFTKAVLQAATKLPQPIVFMLWGASAQNLLMDLVSTPMKYESNKVITESTIKKAYILSSHPSPLSANRQCKGAPPFKGS